MGDFPSYSGPGKQVHMTYLQIAVEGGIPVLILYLMFFYRGFKNLRLLNKMKNLDPEARLFVGAFYASLVGFVVGACFAPEGYQFFPYFAVAYTSALLATAKTREAETALEAVSDKGSLRKVYGNYGKPGSVPVVR